MDDSNFNPYVESVNKTIEGSNQAFYGRSSKISGHECEVKKSLCSNYKNINSFIKIYVLLQLEMVVPVKFVASTFVIKKESPYTQFLNHQISKLSGSGIIQHLLEKHATKKPSCQTEEKSTSIQFKKVIFPFFIYMIGVISALAIFFIELIIAHRNEKIPMSKQNHKVEKHSNTNEIGVQCDLIQGSLNQWTMDDLGSTTGGLETVVSVHNST